MENFFKLRDRAPYEAIGRKRRLLLIAALLAVYYITARLGLKLSAVSGFATFVWPPTGISLAALFFFGFRLWPGVALGAFLVNGSLAAPMGVALGMAAGNTLEALTGAYLLRRLGFLPTLENLKSVLYLMLPVALGSTLISATLGTLSLFWAGMLPQSAFGATWLTWWLGDVMGNLIIAPFLLFWGAGAPLNKELRKIAEALLLSIMTLLCCLVIFTDWIVVANPVFPRPSLIFPIMMIVAVRLGQRGVVTANLLLAVIVIYATAAGQGRFLVGSLAEDLLQVQMFLAALVISKLVLVTALAERNRLYLEAQKAIRARDEFLSIASHELKTPLTSLLLQIQRADQSMGPEPTIVLSHEEIARAISVSSAQVIRLTVLVEDLLDVSKINAGKLNLRVERVNLRDLVKDTVEYLSSVAAEAKCPIELNIHGRGAVGLWDQSRIEQTVVNLLTNAIKYAPGKPIMIDVDEDEQYATLIVKDAGPGIPKEYQAKIFERFERAAASKTTSGLGLGLFIAHQIVQAHRGSIHVESELEQGAKFIVKLPLGFSTPHSPMPL